MSEYGLCYMCIVYSNSIYLWLWVKLVFWYQFFSVDCGMGSGFVPRLWLTVCSLRFFFATRFVQWDWIASAIQMNTSKWSRLLKTGQLIHNWFTIDLHYRILQSVGDLIAMWWGGLLSVHEGQRKGAKCGRHRFLRTFSDIFQDC